VTLHDLNVIPLWIVTLLFAGLMFGAMYFGSRLQRFVGTDPATVGSGQLIFGTVSLLTLLTGFTFSLALNRSDLRRDLVLEESNAIRAMNRALVHVAEPAHSQLSASLRTYTKGRLDFVRANLIKQQEMEPRLIADREKFNRVVANVDPDAKTGVNQSQVLALATRILDAGTRMEMISSAHVPPRVVLMLILLSSGTAIVIGISIGDRFSSLRLPIGIWSLLMAMVLFTIVDLDSTQWGSIRLDYRPLENAMRALEAQR
jgi:hypothetical protein